MLEGVKQITGHKVAIFPWDDAEPDGLRFRIRALSKIEKAALPVFNDEALRRKKAVRFDIAGYSKRFARMAIVGWDGMKRRHLPEILDLSKLDFDASVEPEKEIKFSEKEKEELLENMNEEFAGFVAAASEAAAKHGKEQEKN